MHQAGLVSQALVAATILSWQVLFQMCLTPELPSKGPRQSELTVHRMIWGLSYFFLRSSIERQSPSPRMVTRVSDAG